MEWTSVFGFALSPWEIILRGSLVFWFIFFLLRIVGRRDFGSIGASNILLLVLIADAAQNAMSADYTTVPEGMVLIGTLVFWSAFIDILCYFVPVARPLFQPSSICLVKDGVMQRRGMRKEYVTADELMTELRMKGIDDIAQVKRAYIEENGDVSVICFKGKEEGGSMIS